MSPARLWNRIGLCVLGLVSLAGRAGAATSYARMTAQLQDDCQRSSLIQMTGIGASASGARTIWLVRVGSPVSPAIKPLRILVLCRQHGDEPASTEAMLKLLGDVAARGKSVGPVYKNIVLYAVPMVNPDGAEANTRGNGAGADLNRDWGLFTQPESRAVYRAYKAIRPQLVLDLHSWDETDPFRQVCIEGPRATYATTGLESALEALRTDATRGVGEHLGQPVAATTYGGDADTTLCHRFFWEKTGTPALLFETDAGRDTAQSLGQKTATAYSFLRWILADAAARRGYWTAFLKAKPAPASDALFPSTAASQKAAPPSRPARPVWQNWLALIFFGVGVFLRYGLPRRGAALAPLGRRRLRPVRRTPLYVKARLRARTLLSRKTIAPDAKRRPYFRFAQPDQRRRDAGRADFGRQHPARRVHQQVY